MTAEEFAGLKLLLPIAVYFAVLLVTAAGALPLLYGAVVGLPLAGLAYIGLPLAVDIRIHGRRDAIVSALPAVLDLLTLSVEAGMSFDAALQRVNRRLHGPLIDELTLLQRDMQLGTSRGEAMQGSGHPGRGSRGDEFRPRAQPVRQARRPSRPDAAPAG